MNPTITEAQWERHMMFLGSERYDRSNEGKQASQTTTGKAQMRRLIRVCTEAIETLQKDLVRAHRTERTVKGTVIIIPAETLAMITLKTLMDAAMKHPKPHIGPDFQTLCRSISKAVETELNFRHWIATSREEVKEWAKENGLDKTPKSLAEKIVAEQGVHRNSMSSWRRSFAELTTYSWTDLSQYYCGDALLAAVIPAVNASLLEELGADAFEVHTPIIKNRKAKRVRATDAFHKMFNAKEGRVSELKATRLPMLTKPNAWRET